MTPSTDPYRTLGLEVGASPGEIKRAYRRLAKAYHPDNAGERALPRFLAIQAAYERLTDAPLGSTGRGPRKAAEPRSSADGPAAPPPGRSWRAEAERARATREASRRRTNRTSGRSPGAEPGPSGGPPGPGPGARPGPPPGARPAGTGGATDRPGRSTSRRAKPKATIGSTSYDGTENEPFEPGWSGATWYGAASGTYWTINPKEYADPRKHGPEYLARARRNRAEEAGGDDAPSQPARPAKAPPAEAEATGPTPDQASPPTDGKPARPARPAPASTRGTQSARPPSARPQPGQPQPGQPQTGRSETGPASPGDVPRPAARPTPAPSPAREPTAGSVAGPPARPSLELSWVKPGRVLGSWRGRILLAALAWFPIGLAIFGIHGQLTGCAQFLAQCTDAVGWSVWIPQLVVFGLLLLSPRLSWIGGSASLGLLIVAVPLAGLLTSISGGRPPSSGAAELLVGAMSLGWLAGVGLALSGRIPLPPWRSRTMRQ
jgi:hypothetical protein